MDHPNNPYNNDNNSNNQDHRGDKLGKISVLADWDGRSQLHKKFIFPPTQLGYGVNANQERSSWHQLGSNFTQEMHIASSIGQINPTHNINNLIHGWGSTSGVSQCVIGSSQIPRSDSNAEDPRNSHLVESRTQGEMPGGSKICKCKKSRCLSLYCECFSYKRYCKNCKCQDCGNIVKNEYGIAEALKELFQNNPTAFDFKGCTCKSSCCKKGYCVCKANNVKCADRCRCINCKNPIGARDNGEITVPGEMNTQAEQNNTPANVPVEQQQVLVRCPNYGTWITETGETNHGTMPLNVHTNEAVNNQQLIPFEDYLFTYSTAPSNNNNNNNDTMTTTTPTPRRTITMTTTTTPRRRRTTVIYIA